MSQPFWPHSQGRRDASSVGEPPNYNDETPKFCLHYARNGFTAQQQASFAKTLQKLAVSKWKDLITADRHGPHPPGPIHHPSTRT